MFPMFASALPSVEEPLPEQSPAAEDLAPFANPVDEMAPVPVVAEKVPKGVSFNWAVLRAETQDEYDAKPPEIQHLIHEIQQLGTLPSQEWAANRVIEIQKEIANRTSPKAQAEAAQAQIALAAADAEAKSKANESAAARTRISSALDSINKLEPDLDNLVGPLAPAAQMKDKWVNPEIYAKRFELANTTKNDVLEAAKYVKPLSNDERKFLEDMFPKIDDPAPVWRSYFERSRRMLSAGLGDSTPAPQATPQGTSSPQAPAPPPAERIIGGQLFRMNPQTGKYVPAR
jgi:hypothetical protein